MYISPSNSDFIILVLFYRITRYEFLQLEKPSSRRISRIKPPLNG